MPFELWVEKTWARLSGSSVWLPKYRVFLTVTRVIYYDKGKKDWPVISFMTGQIHDRDWTHLPGYTIELESNNMTFPYLFDAPTDYTVGGAFYGPEDPRIILEEGVEDAEPVIIFNMISEESDYLRRMWIYRPFTNHSTMLTIRDADARPLAEKNWAPFFHRSSTDAVTSPNTHLHFVYSLGPLHILKCDLQDGNCDFVFVQKSSLTSASRKHMLQNAPGSMRGGTNFVPVPIDMAPGIHAYAAFPRTHIGIGCAQSTYRPELVVLVSVGPYFFLTYASEALEFGTAAFTPTALRHPCKEGRILIANSIASWDTHSQDIMTLSFSIDDSTVQVARLQGLRAVLKQLPFFQQAEKHDAWTMENQIRESGWITLGSDVLACSVQSAANSSIAAVERIYYEEPEDKEIEPRR